MTIQECINRFNYLKPHGYDDETLIRWLSTLEQRIYHEIICWHYEADEFVHPLYTEKDLTAELLVPDEYADVYLYYLQAQVDYFNAETARYNNAMAMFNAALSNFADNFNRSHMPREKEVILP